MATLLRCPAWSCQQPAATGTGLDATPSLLCPTPHEIPQPDLKAHTQRMSLIILTVLNLLTYDVI